MKMRMSGSTAQLEGNWTITGVKQNHIDALAGTLQQIEPGSARTLQIDCHQVTAIDTSGLELLYVWMQCARIRGFEPELINLPDTLRHYFQKLGLQYDSTDLAPLGRGRAGLSSSHRTRRTPHENRRNQGNRQAASH